MSFPVAEEAIENTIDEVDDVVNPWTVTSNSAKGIDYDKLIRMLLFNIIYYFYILLIC
jgi:hypothetical protein